MTADDSIRTDASTVHRPSPVGDSPAQSLERSKSAVKEIAEARTVIRGSSRAITDGNLSEPIDRTPASVAKVLLGQRLNHFRLEAMIGGGGMGAVFRAHDEQLDRIVAIKVIPFVSEDADLQRRFRNESQSAAKLDHPRIAKVFDAGNHGQWHYIVFEYVEGTNIRDWVQSHGPLSIDEAVFFTVQLADALQHASDRGIVHRDVKPSNVLIGNDGKIKLVDMGLARSDNFELSEDMTASGVTLGTFDYISPEQAHDPRDADLRSDLYSLGCTLYFMLTGSPPYPGGTMLQKLLSHGNAPSPDARMLRKEVSPNLVAVLHKMLAKKPSDRYQNASDLVADLHVVAARDGLTRSSATGSVTVAGPNAMIGWIERNLPWIAASMLLLLIAGWLQLESAANREEVVIPNTASRPSRITTPAVQRDTSIYPAVIPVAPDDSLPTAPKESPDMTRPSSAPSGQTPLSTPTPSQTPASAGVAAQPSTINDEPALAIPSRPISDPDPAAVAAMMAQRAAIGPTPRLTDFPMPTELITPTPMRRDDESITAASQRPIMTTAEPIDIVRTPTIVRVVGPELDPAIDRDSSGAALSPTLSRAIELAKQFQIRRIEIAVPILVSEPVRVDVDDLRITSSIGGGSVIVFQSPDHLSMERSKMFSIGSHPIEFNDLHFVWNVPSDELDGGAMFEINENRSIELTDCSVTVNNPALREEVYAFDIVTDPDKLTRSTRDDSAVRDVFPLIDVKLYNVVVRGQMSMVHMDYAAKLWLDWDNGLLAVTNRMIDTAGARVPPTPNSGSIKLSLTRVTAHAPKGILQARLGVSGGYPVPISRLSRKSLFIVNSGSPYFEISGMPTDQAATEWLRLEGSSNAYVVDPALRDPILQISMTDGQIATTRMSELSTSPPSWADENRPKWSVKWATTRLTDIPMSQRRPADYRQVDTASPPGFEEKSLPTLPVIADNGLTFATP